MIATTSDSFREPDPSLCPLCGQDNRCALEIERAAGLPQPPCWCTRVGFDPALLEQVPGRFRRVSCICPSCAAGRPGAGAAAPPPAG